MLGRQDRKTIPPKRKQYENTSLFIFSNGINLLIIMMGQFRHFGQKKIATCQNVWASEGFQLRLKIIVINKCHFHSESDFNHLWGN